MWECEL